MILLTMISMKDVAIPPMKRDIVHSTMQSIMLLRGPR